MPYVAIPPRAGIDYDADGRWVDDRGTCTVFEDERQPVSTGLLNSSGVPIYRVPEAIRIGFVRD